MSEPESEPGLVSASVIGQGILIPNSNNRERGGQARCSQISLWVIYYLLRAIWYNRALWSLGLALVYALISYFCFVDSIHYKPSGRRAFLRVA